MRTKRIPKETTERCAHKQGWVPALAKLNLEGIAEKRIPPSHAYTVFFATELWGDPNQQRPLFTYFGPQVGIMYIYLDP